MDADPALSSTPIRYLRMVPLSCVNDSEEFTGFHYAELKDLDKHFLTMSSAALVFLLTFVDKLIRSTLVEL